MSLVKGRGGGGVWGPPGGFGISVGKKYSAHPLPMNKGWAFDSLLRPMRGCHGVFLVQSEFSSYKAGGFRWYKMPYIWILALDVENRVFSKSVRGGRWVPQDLRKVSTSVSGKNIPPTPCL